MEPFPNHRVNRGQAVMDEFLAHLSVWDLLILRKRVNEIELHDLANLIDLPAELIINISFLLPLSDLLSCFQVCRRWNQAWTQPAVMVALIHHHFPGQMQIRGHDQEPYDLFRNTTLQYLRRHHKTCWQSALIKWDASETTEVFSPINQYLTHRSCNSTGQIYFLGHEKVVCYQDGMIAWQPDMGSCIVDDLRSRTRQWCPFGAISQAGLATQAEAVTRRLVVFSIFPSLCRLENDLRCKEIRVWDLNTEEWKIITLPGLLAKVYVDDITVVVTTLQKHIIAWSLHDQAIDLDTDDTNFIYKPRNTKAELGGVPGVIFHPCQRDVLFVVWLYSLKEWEYNPAYVFVVVKYKGRKPIKRFEKVYNPPSDISALTKTSGYVGCTISWRMKPSYRKENVHGLYTLGVSRWRCLEAGKEAIFESVSFNVITESFHVNRYILGEDSYSDDGAMVETFALWDGEINIIEYIRNNMDVRQSLSGLRLPSVTAEYTEERNGQNDSSRNLMGDINDWVRRNRGPCDLYADENFLVVVALRGILVYTSGSYLRGLDLPTLPGDASPSWGNYSPNSHAPRTKTRFESWWDDTEIKRRLAV